MKTHDLILSLRNFGALGIVLGISVGGYVSLDMFLLAMLDDVFGPCLMYIHILANCCSIFQMLSNMLLFTFKKKPEKNKKK